MESKTLGGMLDEIMARLDQIEETLDEILDLARTRGYGDDPPEDPMGLHLDDSSWS